MPFLPFGTLRPDPHLCKRGDFLPEAHVRGWNRKLGVHWLKCSTPPPLRQFARVLHADSDGERWMWKRVS